MCEFMVDRTTETLTMDYIAVGEECLVSPPFGSNGATAKCHLFKRYMEFPRNWREDLQGPGYWIVCIYDQDHAEDSLWKVPGLGSLRHGRLGRIREQ